ncbi:hypothetical protein SNA_09335 [Streptomyces natalensis ATCC 27448]|uniref:Uncharacterized protein n=1 Tax=Streptomyces natalensis ATCC 27448 TaxID=1240678 RepID=A0A0D7CPQ2_9ACTN|nr:hypothetical protein SNA_09335 [Streptomyces natalensis ATCC 27448]
MRANQWAAGEAVHHQVMFMAVGACMGGTLPDGAADAGSAASLRWCVHGPSHTPVDVLDPRRDPVMWCS